MMMAEMVMWAWLENLPFVVTETFTTFDEDMKLKRKSVTHREGRAFDVSTRDWPEDKIKSFMEFFEKKYDTIAAISTTTGGPLLIVRHDTGSGDHMHVQINKKFAVADTITKGGLA
jgi:hypothetical protein